MSGPSSHSRSAASNRSRVTVQSRGTEREEAAIRSAQESGHPAGALLQGESVRRAKRPGSARQATLPRYATGAVKVDLYTIRPTLSGRDRQQQDPASQRGNPGKAIQRLPATAPGKRTLVEGIAPAPVQAKGAPPGNDPATVQYIAEQGTSGLATTLPHADAIQRAFGRHDISQVQAFVGGAASDASAVIGAEAYATGDRIAFRGPPTLHTAAHEAAHVIQQRGGVQLKGGVGEAGDAYERHADAVADRVAAGQSAEALLDAPPSGGATHAIQRQVGGDAAELASQASLKNTDVEIPAIEGALLSIRKEAVRRGLLSKTAFDAGLALSSAMTQLQPAVAAKGKVDLGTQEAAAVAAQQLYAALKAETSDEKNFKIQPNPGDTSGVTVTSQNPYTGETRLSTIFSTISASWLERLPELIRQNNWTDAFRGYRQLSDGVDLWVADQLRKSGKGTADAAKGDAQQHYAQLRTALDQIAEKHATRLPAVFHPDPETIASERAAGRAASDAIPMNVYYWTEPDGKVHLYDVTAPNQPREQTIEGAPTAAAMATFFEEVARYPKGQVNFQLPGGSGVAPTTGKIKWYEWIGYVGLAVAAVGLALATAGASVPATVCFAAGAIAGGVSAGGHLLDSTQLGTATTASVVLDVAQIVASFASLGAMSITVKAGSAAAAAANSRWFVPLVSTAAGADVVQLVALSDITFHELDKVQKGAGSAEDKQRAMAVLITQLIVVGGLTALSVKGARDARALAGKPLELVEVNGQPVVRVAGETALPTSEAEIAARDMRWQMELKNEKLVAEGQQPRYPDVDAAVAQGMKDFQSATERGFPYAFKDKAAFEQFGSTLKSGVAAKPAPASGIPVPTEHAVVQGSAVYRPAADDVDVALLVTQEQFDRLIEQSFPNQIKAIRARGIDPLRMSMGDANSAAERTLANAVETGVLKRDKVVPRLSDVRDQLQAVVGKKVDLSVVKVGGQFDHGPYFPIP